ncbi:hypothetical protein [Lewinella sp. IMCC34183]|uniref:hypothetical protein n=1 Tax=Lewinella sp. IMCC34183 TaxID=2248762 RepID=UPI001300705C|nr:hypothetical protein [Lewinella sp. IMCC34183]
MKQALPLLLFLFSFAVFANAPVAVPAASAVPVTVTDPITGGGDKGTTVERADSSTAPRLQTFTEQHHRVIALIDFLQDTPADKDVAQRKQATAQIEAWLDRTNDVSVEVDEKLRPYLRYGESKAIFMGRYAQFALMHPTTDYVAANIAGVYSVVSYYLDNKEALGFDVLLEKLVDMRAKGRLRGFIKRRVS